MRRLREKLHNESGASILLAMLLLLVCCMVAASILAAAASNAGKIRSNRAEQQKYLTLSSAIRLVADEIQKAEYTWKYTVYEWDTAGGSYFYCEQNEGTYSCGDLTAQLPLKKSLEGELKKQFPSGDGYKSLENATVEGTTVCNLLVTLPDNLDGYPYSDSISPAGAYRVPGEVTVRVELNHATRHITLTAWLEDKAAPPVDKSDTMIAELVAEGEMPALNYNNPESRTPGGTDANPLPEPFEDGDGDGDTSASAMEKKEQTATMKWKLNRIRKGAG